MPLTGCGNDMKSRLISTVLNDPDSAGARTFARDLAVALALADEDRAACLNMLPSIRFAKTKRETQRLLERLVDDLQADRDKLQRALGVMDFLLAAFLSKDVPDSDWEFWGSDLEEMGQLDSSTRPVFEAMVTSIRSELATEVEPETRRMQAAAGVLPVFQGCAVTVEVRSVRENSYSRGTSIEEFEPQVVDTTTMASVGIVLDMGPFKEVFFQADESDLDYLINVFQAAKKEMAALRGFLKLNA